MRPIHLWPARASSAIPTLAWAGDLYDPIVAAGRSFDRHVNLCGACRDWLTLCPIGTQLYASYAGAVDAERETALAAQGRRPR